MPGIQCRHERLTCPAAAVQRVKLSQAVIAVATWRVSRGDALGANRRQSIPPGAGTGVQLVRFRYIG